MGHQIAKLVPKMNLNSSFIGDKRLWQLVQYISATLGKRSEFRKHQIFNEFDLENCNLTESFFEKITGSKEKIIDYFCDSIQKINLSGN